MQDDDDNPIWLEGFKKILEKCRPNQPLPSDDEILDASEYEVSELHEKLERDYLKKLFEKCRKDIAILSDVDIGALPEEEISALVDILEEYRFKKLHKIFDKKTPLPSDAEINAMPKETFHERYVKLLKKEQLLLERRVAGFMSDAKKRENTAQYRRKVALDWLRLEPYSTVAVMKLVLRMSGTGTRKLLDKMVVENLLLKTKVSCVGVSGKVCIYGVSSKGLYDKKDADGVEPGVDRDFKPRKYNPLTAQHAINLQLARLYYQRLDNPGGKIKRRYRADRDLPYFGQKEYQWKTNPDGVIDNSHLFSEHNSAHRLSIAIEIEQHDKGSKRYYELLKAHADNINEPHLDEYGCSARYDKVIYLLKDENEVKNFKKMLYEQIDKSTMFKGSDKDKQRAVFKQRFIFDTYNDLAQRIRELDACVAL